MYITNNNIRNIHLHKEKINVIQFYEKSNSLDKLELGAVETENKPQEKKSYVDERIWKPTMDKTGNGFAIIRFLPASEGEEMLLGQKYGIMLFKGLTGQWYIENSLTTIGQNDPVSEHNSVSGTLVLRVIKKLLVNRRESCSIIQISML